MSSNVEDIVASLNAIGPDAHGNSNEAARQQVLDAARRLVNRTQNPWERAWELAIAGPSVFSATQVLLDLGVFEGWAKNGGRESSLDELLTLCNAKCETNLLRRLLRILASFNVIEETGEDQWKATDFSLELGKPDGPIALTILSGTHHAIPAGENLPGYLAKTSYREPLDPNKGNYADFDDQGLDFFARCQADPRYQASFINGIMVGIATQKVDWTEVYDTKSLVDGFSSSDGGVCVVDTGGAHGIDIMRMLARHPELPQGALVLQDLPDVVAMAKIDSKIETMPYNFFTPQPVQGSRAYFMHAVLHDWTDPEAKIILGNLAPAMKKGHSKLLIYEVVIPPTGASPLQTTVDIGLMTLLSAAERTEAMWRQLIESCGLKVVKIWTNPLAMESVIEAELA
ncbi:Uu.00g145460.m01.CDS01 [Anthostomella pinea]|uniref:Uu.00g145460.m01.CDS01 n=1 Tax=Anthostomella pinea TaxID=933095 RepID=A0AAI8VKK0_9PEZI|nr:Uu.00g145460.m01.CDS01 [Anthostomella pinea]